MIRKKHIGRMKRRRRSREKEGVKRGKEEGLVRQKRRRRQKK